jgi:hypothetical protein
LLFANIHVAAATVHQDAHKPRIVYIVQEVPTVFNKTDLEAVASDPQARRRVVAADSDPAVQAGGSDPAIEQSGGVPED